MTINAKDEPDYVDERQARVPRTPAHTHRSAADVIRRVLLNADAKEELETFDQFMNELRAYRDANGDYF
jgi:hypothetical protein